LTLNFFWWLEGKEREKGKKAGKEFKIADAWEDREQTHGIHQVRGWERRESMVKAPAELSR